jgi:hypothetical protein
LQATAVVVNTAPALEAMQAARYAVQRTARGQIHDKSTVATLASVAVARSSRSSDGVVLTIAYLKN